MGQKQLETRLRTDVGRVWADMLADVHPRLYEDPFAVALTHHVTNLDASGVAVPECWHKRQPTAPSRPSTPPVEYT